MERAFLKKATRSTLNLLLYLKLRAVKIIREVVNIFFIVTALFLAVPGLYRLIEQLDGAKFISESSVLLTAWLAIAITMAVPAYFFSNMRYSFSWIFSLDLFLSLIGGLGFLAYREKYLYFLGIWFAISAATWVIPRAYKRMRVHLRQPV